MSPVESKIQREINQYKIERFKEASLEKILNASIILKQRT